MPAVFVESGSVWTYIFHKGCRLSALTGNGRWKQRSGEEATHLHMLQVIMDPHGTAGFLYPPLFHFPYFGYIIMEFNQFLRSSPK